MQIGLQCRLLDWLNLPINSNNVPVCRASLKMREANMTLIITRSNVPLFGGYCWQYRLASRCVSVTGNQRARRRCLVTLWLTAGFSSPPHAILFPSALAPLGATSAGTSAAGSHQAPRGTRFSMRSGYVICRWPANRSINGRTPLPWPTPRRSVQQELPGGCVMWAP